MIDNRIGDYLWIESAEEVGLYYTPEHVDLEEEIVRRALASAMQRDGIVDSLFEGFEKIATAEITISWMGSLPDDPELLECDEQGETFYGEIVEEIQPCTLVRFN